MSQFFAVLKRASFAVISITFISTSAHALDLDWHGQFRTETNWIYGYSHNQVNTAGTATDQGYFIPLNGESPASFQNLFLRLTPRAIVNDNVSIFTNIWVGTPDRGIFGGNTPTNLFVNSTNTGNALISASLLYAQIATDFGTLNVGRVPLHWGLGVVYNTTAYNKAGDAFDRMPSTADGFRLETKLGAFKVSPAVYKYSAGSNYGGTAGAGGTTTLGTSTASDYSLGILYSNDDEQMDLGLMFTRRLAGLQSGVIDPVGLGTGTGYAYNVWDFYLKKKAGVFTFGAEVPLVSGLVGTKNYSSVAAAVEVNAQVNDHWNVGVKGGMASGQDNITAGSTASKVTAFAFHPDYRPGLLMFNYNFRNLSSNNTNTGIATSPYNNPITNAQYFSLGFKYESGKWSHSMLGLYAMADKAADGVAGNQYYNSWDRHMQTEAAGATKQEKGLGFEIDYTLGYEWDDSLNLGFTTGLLIPGKFYEFSNSATLNTVKTAFGMGLNLMVKF